MIIKNIAKNRTFTNVVLNADYVVAGGGLTGGVQCNCRRP